MKIIISPAKKMIEDSDSLPEKGLPQFIDRAEVILEKLQSMNYMELKKLWSCNDSIAKLNCERLALMDLREKLTPAILSYDGIQYKRMAPGVFTESQLVYVENNLRILSGFYGVLKPFDGVKPYRLEMQAKLKINQCSNLYEFWGEDIYKSITDEDDLILNLASKEYSKCVSSHLKGDIRFLSCNFFERDHGRLIEKGTICKMLRGELVRFLAVRNVSSPEEIKEFTMLGFEFSAENSDSNNYRFIKE